MKVAIKVQEDTLPTGSMVLVERGGEQHHLTRLEEKLQGTVRGVDLRDFAKDRLCNPVDTVEDSVRLKKGKRLDQIKVWNQPQNVRLRLQMMIDDGDA